MAMILHSNSGNLQSIEFQQKYGDTLTSGLSLNGTICGTYWNLILLARWSLTSLVLVALRDYCVFQILILLSLSIAVQIFLCVSEPLKDRTDKLFSMFNEIMVSANLYVLLTLTDYNTQLDYRENCGIILILLIGLAFTVNLARTLVMMTVTAYREIRDYIKKRKGVVMIRQSIRDVDPNEKTDSKR